MANIPPLKVLPSAFAQFALDTYKNVIAAIRGSSTPSNAATYQDGFGESTFKPVSSESSSGIPPRGGDVNGILNDLSTPIYRAQMGLPINTWDASIASQGYPRGAIVWYNSNLYKSLMENNSSNPTTLNWELVFSFPVDNFIGFPDYSKYKDYPAKDSYTSNQFTAPYSGLLSVHAATYGSSQFTISINGYSNVIQFDTGDGSDNQTINFFLKKGDTFQITNSSGLYKLRLYEFRK